MVTTGKGAKLGGRHAQEGEEAMKKIRGVYEKMAGPDVYWIRYADASGRIRREKVGPKSVRFAEGVTVVFRCASFSAGSLSLQAVP